MATRRNKIMDAPVNPAIFPGLIMVADTVTTVKTESHVVSFPAKSILAVLTSTKADTDAEKVTSEWSVTNNVATVTFTPTSAGTAAPYSYIILATVTETIPVLASLNGVPYTPVG